LNAAANIPSSTSPSVSAALACMNAETEAPSVALDVLLAAACAVRAVSAAADCSPTGSSAVGWAAGPAVAGAANASAATTARSTTAPFCVIRIRW
jgi:hypothetical protein